MPNVQQLTSVDQWQEAYKKTSEKPLVVFKHSTRCDISAGAHEDYMRYVEDLGEKAPADFAIVHVIEDRPVSNAIAETLGVQHKSPQAILVQDGRAVWHDSHWNLTYEFFADKLGKPANAAE